MQKSSKSDTNLYQLLYDGHRFAQYFANTIKVHPLLIYTAALPFTPTNTSIFKTFYHSGLPKVVCGVDKVWSRELIQLQGHDGPIFSVAFSPDGSKIISGSEDETIRVWDASTGIEMLPPLRGHDDSINSVAFSPDGSKIISGSRDSTIRVWDAGTGTLLPSLQIASDDAPQPAMNELMAEGWLTNIDTGRYMGALPVGVGFHCGQLRGYTYVGWTAGHKLVLIHFPG